MPAVVVNLVIDAEEYQRMYAGTARVVTCRSVDGRRIQFPANILRRFVSLEGIRGRFLIHFSDEGRFQSIERLD
ncbi:MAG: DUF2835 domain-containing protein [Gammaproteobacteria bacterium]|nr:DUF2835 domain-containing protein [Gammaproteobacteria bacterium]